MQTTATSQTLQSIPRGRSMLDALIDIPREKLEPPLTLFEQPNNTIKR